MRDEDIPVFFIPANYQNGVSVFGNSVDLPNLVQAVLFGSIPWVLVYLGLPSLGVPVSGSGAVSPCIFFSAALTFAGLHGINGATLLEYLKAVAEYSRKRRTAYYNPRIKTEAVPSLLQADGGRNLLPREKLMEFYKKAMETYNARQAEAAVRAQATGEADSTSMYFNDDAGYVDKPVEYMTRKEYRQYRCAKRRAARTEGKAERKRRKESRKKH